MVTIERRCIRLETIEPLDMGRLILSLSGNPFIMVRSTLVTCPGVRSA
jgi:hypothetical protein